MSTPSVKTSDLAKIVDAFACRKASTIPLPVPISTISGVGDGTRDRGEEVKRRERKFVSDEEDKVSRRRKESSAGV